MSSKRKHRRSLSRTSAKQRAKHSVNARWRWIGGLVVAVALTAIGWTRTTSPSATSPIPQLFSVKKSLMLSPAQEFDFDANAPLSTFAQISAQNAPRQATAGKVRSTIKMTYDDFNRMTSWSNGKHTERYEYRVISWQRIKTIIETRNADDTLTTQTTKHLYDRDNVIADFNEQNQMVAFYVTPELDQPLSVTFYEYDTNGQRNNKTTYYYHYDGLGSVRALTDENGKIVADYDYTAFGESNDKISSVLRRQKNAEKNRYTFTGRERSPLAEFGAPMNYRNRSYQPSLGRFIQRDPIGYGDGANVYGYVNNRPVNNVDPLGKNTQPCGLDYNCSRVKPAIKDISSSIQCMAEGEVLWRHKCYHCQHGDCDLRTGKICGASVVLLRDGTQNVACSCMDY